MDTQFKLNGESDSEILSNIIKNHLASNGYYLDVDSLMDGIALKEIVDVIDDKVMSLIDLLQKKGDYNLSGMGSNNARIIQILNLLTKKLLNKFNFFL